MFKTVYFRREGWILGVSHNRLWMFTVGIFWQGGVDYGSVAYSGEEGGYILEEGLDSGRGAYPWGRGCIFWEGRVDSGRAG